MSLVLPFVLTLLLVVALVGLGVLYDRYRNLRQKYAPVVDVDAEVQARRDELAGLSEAIADQEAEFKRRRTDLTERYATAKVTYDLLARQVAQLEENLEDVSFGLYKPHYGFDSSEAYKRALEGVWSDKKAMIKAGTAAMCSTSWSVGGSAREGEKMARQQIKLMLRAFNGECDAAVAKVAWNNVTRMEERIRKAFEAINQSGTSMQISISPRYRDLALAELHLAHEQDAKKHEEQEEQRAIRDQMRDEERAQREFERAERDAATEQARYEKALAKARADLETATGGALDVANEKVRELEARLAEAQAKMQRALSMAQMTKTGHVYVISNVGSFGEDVFKIGMTRRLEPMERVHELGDASVPFSFDVHAMIYSEDAPGLENAFHRHFASRRLNLVNQRKEYFQVRLADIEEFARQRKVPVVITRLAEAREYRETLAIRNKAESPVAPTAPVVQFPVALTA